MSSTSEPARSAWTAVRPASRPRVTAAIASESVTTSPAKPRSSRSRSVTTLRESEDGTRGSTARTSRCPTITAGSPASTAPRKGTRSDSSSPARVFVCTGSVRWLSAGTDPWPGKCLITGSTPDDEKPSAAATTCSDTARGRDDGEREPIVGSPGPDVTSASGAKSTVNPRPRSSAPLAAYALRVSAVSSAAPALMKVGNRVAAPRNRSTTPPSWSTPRKSGHFRPARRLSAALTALDLRGRHDVGVERDHAPEVEVADHRHGRGRPAPLGHDQLAGELGQAQAPDQARSPVQLGPVRPPALGQPELLRGAGRGRRGRGRRTAGSRLPSVRLPVRRLVAAGAGRQGSDERDRRQRRYRRAPSGAPRTRQRDPRQHPAMVARRGVVARGGPGSAEVRRGPSG